MKILHVIPSLSPTQGGPSFAMPLIERALHDAGIAVTTVTTDDDGRNAHVGLPLEQAIRNNGATRYFFRKQTEFYKYSRPLSRWLAANVASFDIVHIHAIFSHASVAAARWARRNHVPYIIRPLGVLNRYGMTKRRAALKQLSMRFVEAPVLRHAAAMHYTSEQERIEAEEAGATAPPFILPLGLDLEPFLSPCSSQAFHERFPTASDRDVVLFLSRLDPKKGLDRLLDAFALVRRQHPKALLVVAGEGSPEFVAGLKLQASRLAIADDVLWAGFLEGDMKRAALAAARVYVLPSYSENFGIAAVEALACGVPSVLTPEVGISDDVKEANAGLIVNGDPFDLAEAIARVLQEPELANSLATNGRNLARERFSLEAMSKGLRVMYERVLSKKMLKAEI